MTDEKDFMPGESAVDAVSWRTWALDTISKRIRDSIHTVFNQVC